MAATRYLMPYVVSLATRHNSGSLHDARRLGVATALTRIYEILKDQPRFMTEAAKDEVGRLSVSLFCIYRLLSVEALGARLLLWKMIPKFHIMQHIFEYQLFINPRFVWVYADEDLQKEVKHVALSCHPTKTPHMVLYKWAVSKFDDT